MGQSRVYSFTCSALNYSRCHYHLYNDEKSFLLIFYLRVHETLVMFFFAIPISFASLLSLVILCVCDFFLSCAVILLRIAQFQLNFVKSVVVH